MNHKLFKSFLQSLLFFITVVLSNNSFAQTTSYSTQYPINHVRTWILNVPVREEQDIDNLSYRDVTQTTVYADGLARPIQTVIKKGSLVTNENDEVYDLVIPTVYDGFGRQSIKYLPFVSNDFGGNVSVNDGNFKLNPIEQQQHFYSDNNSASPIFGQGEIKYFGKTDFEASPMNTALKGYAPGNSWSGNNVGSSVLYTINDSEADDVKIWQVNEYNECQYNSIYLSGTLQKIVTTDEHNKRVIEYKDNEGKTILKKVQLANNVNITGDGYDGWLCTYYVYDNFNLLRVVIPPKAMSIILENHWTSMSKEFTDMLCFKYEYDSRNRMKIKKVPGAAPVYLVYDKWDRLVLTQDGVMRESGKWLFTKFDYFNRPVYTGTIDNTATIDQMQAELDNSNLGRYESLVNVQGFNYTVDGSFPPLGAQPKILTVTYYDHYKFANQFPEAFQAKNNNFDLKFTSPINESPLYAQPLLQNQNTKGMVTGKLAYLLGGNGLKFLASAFFYDSKGRIIQVVSDNASGGVDFNTTQYNFIGQPLQNILFHEKKYESGNHQHNLNVVTKMQYDKLNRLLKIQKQIIQVTPDNMKYGSSLKTVVENEYNSIGQVRSKKLGFDPGETSPLETLTYDYNIRGWLTGINRNYINDPEQNKHFFGMELAYDKTAAADASTSYSNPQLNGNIAGTIWRTQGDETSRKYEYKYDNVNRLMAAYFVQKNGTGSNPVWDRTSVDFTVVMGDGDSPETAYDENGNILRMQQWGLKLNVSTKIDDLKYTYQNNGQSNQLQNVIDVHNYTAAGQAVLGDFWTSEEHPQIADKNNQSTDPHLITDYEYDVNGNLRYDLNKNIRAIFYNLLNLPEKIILHDGKGEITYLYDATGNKHTKTVVDKIKAGKTIITTTRYIAGFVYESKKIDPDTEISGNYEDVLQFTAHEEGRIRYNPVTRQQIDQGMKPTFCFDYFIKDHLGNVRMVLTDEGKEDQYPAATLETDNLANEKTFYTIPDNADTRKNKADVAGYPLNDNTTSPNDFVQRLIGSGTKLGSSIVLKVMSGDKFNVKVSSWYKTNGMTRPDEPVNPLESLVAALTGGIVSASTGGGHPVTQAQIEQAEVLPMALGDFLSDPTQINPDLNRPKAYLNWILLDEQFQYVSSGSGAEQVPAESVYENNTANVHVFDHVRSDLPITKNGYLYVYVSNETPNIAVFFDNLQVTHYRGVIFDETHYYPFGLVQQGISSKAAGMVENKAKFNGIEHNTDFDLNTYEAFYRTLDPQIGRFLQIDPRPTDMVSVYAAMNNDPILYSDPLGDTTWIYDLLGNQLDIIISKTKNQIHYIDADKYHDLETKNTSQGTDVNNAGDPVVNNKQLEKDVRKGSTAFFGSNSAASLQEILNDPKNARPLNDGNEALFTASISKSREIIFNQVAGITSTESQISGVDKQIDNVLSNALQASLFGAGHTHSSKWDYGSPLATLSKLALPSGRDVDIVSGQRILNDFNHVLYRSTTGSKSQHALFVAARIGFSTYSSGSTSTYPTPGNGMFFYSQFKK